MKSLAWTAMVTAFAISAPVASAQTIDIRIGHQSMCTDTYPGGVVIKNLHLLEKYLPHTGRYAGVKYHIVWRDYDSGAPITNMMIADKLDFGVMGDYPLIVNGAKFQALKSGRSLLITGTAYNADGAGNGIVVPASSDVYSLRDLKGKTISVPVGSAAWGMLYKAAEDEGLQYSDFKVINQGPMDGITSIAMKKVDAHADFCPMSEYMEYKGTGRMIYSGSETGIPYLHGVVVRSAFAAKYPEVVEAYLKAVIKADQWIARDPLKASRLMASWTMIPKEVLYLYYSRGGYLTLDPTLKPAWIAALREDHGVLAKYGQIGPLDFSRWVDDRYLRTAYHDLGLNYDRQLHAVYRPARNISRPPEVWVAGHGIKRFKTVDGMMAAVARLDAAHEKIDTTYVYDHETGLKMFGRDSFFVVKKGRPTEAYMRENEAKIVAGRIHGQVYGYQNLLAARVALQLQKKGVALALAGH